MEYRTLSKKVLIGVPHRNNLCVGLSRFLSDVKSYEDYEAELHLSKVMPVDANRNHIVRFFMENTDAEYLLFIDDDIDPPANILDMIRHKQPIVSAVCIIIKNNIPHPLIMREAGEGFKMRDKEDIDEDLIKVDGIGMGCCLIHREVFEKIAPPWFLFERNEYGETMLGEDYYFSKLVQENGFPLFVDAGKLCGHHKVLDLAQVRLAMSNSLRDKEEEIKKKYGIEEEETKDEE